MDLTVANTILDQLGGKFMSMMIGAKDIVGGDNFLQFGFKAKARSGINKIKVTLDASDTYTVEFYKIRGINCKLIEAAYDVYNDNLIQVCESHTGLAFRM